ncbi:MAG: GNAT family N-acetyltransferase [Candidatus Hermodarchaeota archaeon]
MSESRTSFKQKTIRAFFLAFDKRQKKEETIESELSTTGLTYFQMKLPVEKITPEFEEKLRKDVEKNILKAKIREATIEDLPSVCQVYNRSWMTSCTPYRPLAVDTLRQIYDYPETTVLVARVYGADAGFAILDFEGLNQEYGIIAGLGVIPRFQRKGLGTVIGMASWEYFKKKGVKELRCEVYKDNIVSYNFISSLGFEKYDVKTYKSDDFA